MRMISTLNFSSYQRRVYTLALILGLFIFVLPSCTEEVVPSQSIEIKEAGFEKFSIEDLPAMANAIAPFVNPNFEQKVDGKLTVSPQNESELSKALNYDEVLARYDGKGNTNYAMAVADNDDDPFSFSNFIIMKDSTGAFRTPFVLTYEMADDFIEEYLVDKDISKFRGKITQYDLAPMDAQRVDSRNPGTNDPDPGSGGSTGTPPTQDGNVICEKQYAGSGGAPPPSGSWGNVLICEFFINVVYDYTTDGTKNVWYTYITKENCTVMWIAQQDAAGATTCPTDTGEGEIPVLVQIIEQIDLSKLNSCMSNLVMNSYSHLDSKNQLNMIMQTLAGYDPVYNWKLNQARLGSSVNAETQPSYDFTDGSVTTTFNMDKFGRASDISLVRTILHEAIHAYIISVTFAEASSDVRQKLLGPDWLNVALNKGHDYMIRNYIEPMAKLLSSYGNRNNITSSNPEFFRDLAFGGLVHNKDGSLSTLFQQMVPNIADRQRIINTIAIESEGKDSTGQTKNQVGNASGC